MPRTAVSSRATGCGSPAARARRPCAITVTDRVAPGVVYTTFHHPATQANVSPPILRLGHQLPRIQGDRGAGHALERPDRLAGRLRGAKRPLAPDRQGRAGRVSAHDAGKLASWRTRSRAISPRRARTRRWPRVADRIDKFRDPRTQKAAGYALLAERLRDMPPPVSAASARNAAPRPRTSLADARERSSTRSMNRGTPTTWATPCAARRLRCAWRTASGLRP